MTVRIKMEDTRANTDLKIQIGFIIIGLILSIGFIIAYIRVG